MKTRPLLLTILLFPFLLLAAEPPRQTINFNREWKFQLGDHPGAEVAGYDDSKWDDIGLPHSFSIPYFASPRFYTGYGWYRKHFAAPENWTGKKLFLEFDGAFQDAKRADDVAGFGREVGRTLGRGTREDLAQ